MREGRDETNIKIQAVIKEARKKIHHRVWKMWSDNFSFTRSNFSWRAASENKRGKVYHVFSFIPNFFLFHFRLQKAKKGKKSRAQIFIIGLLCYFKFYGLKIFQKFLKRFFFFSFLLLRLLIHCIKCDRARAREVNWIFLLCCNWRRQRILTRKLIFRMENWVLIGIVMAYCNPIYGSLSKFADFIWFICQCHPRHFPASFFLTRRMKTFSSF